MRILKSTLFLTVLALAVAGHGGEHDHGHDCKGDRPGGGGHHGGGGQHDGHGDGDCHHDGSTQNRQRGLITPLHAQIQLHSFHALVAIFHYMVPISISIRWH